MCAQGDRVAVVALGGNAISPPDGPSDIHAQFAQTRASMDAIVSLLKQGVRVAITHGNGPQIGNALLRQELARGRAPELPLGVLVASTEGWMGYMIEQSLMNRLKAEGIQKSVSSIVTQVLVDKHDPSLTDPTKFIGQTYPEYEAHRLAQLFDWVVKHDEGRQGWRRVVGSPMPLEVLNSNAIRHLIDQDWVVICGGGGGIPVFRTDKGELDGVDAVIDKDRASAVLGTDIGAQDLYILTQVDKVYLNFGRKDQVALDSLTVQQAREYLDIGHFPAGSMGPKIESALSFLENGGERVVITDLHHVLEAMQGKAGTSLLP